MMKKLIFSTITASLISFYTCPFADTGVKHNSPSAQYFLDHIAGNLTLTNNYIFRGLSDTRNEAALQGGLTFSFDSKIYVGLWGTNTNFPSPNGDLATFEADEFIGYSNTIKDLSFDLHFVRYDYPRASSATYNELIGSLSYKFITFLMGYSGNVFGSHGPGTYINLGLNVDIPAKYIYFEHVNLSGGVGSYDLDKEAGNSYQDYNILLAKTVGDKYTFSLQWVDTNHKNPPYDGSRWVIAITAKF